MAPVRSLGSRGFAIRQTCVHKVVGNRRVDFELPRRLKNPQVGESAGVPVFCARKWKLSVTDVHRHIVCPHRQLTWDFCSFDREVGGSRSIGSIFSKISYRRIENVLQILTKLIFALCKCGDGKKQTGAQKNKSAEYFLGHSRLLRNN